MAAEQRIADELRNQALLEYLKHVPCNERANGRPLKTLPKEIARLVLADVDAGFTLSAIVRRYRELSHSPGAGWPRSSATAACVRWRECSQKPRQKPCRADCRPPHPKAHDVTIILQITTLITP